MSKIISRLKNIRPFKAITVFLVSIVLFATQACSSVQAKVPEATSSKPDVPGQIVGKQSSQPNSEIYVPKGTNIKSGYEGGMNNYSDVDPRTKTNIKAQSEYLEENAQRNIDDKSVDSAQQYGRNYREGTPLGERSKRLGEDVKQSAQELGQGLVKGTQQGIKNIKENTKDAASGVSDSVR
jgi:hypothetical protein